MQAVIPARLVTEHQRSRLALALFSADLQEGFKCAGILVASPQPFGPRIGDRGQIRVGLGTERLDKVGQWIIEVFVFAFAEPELGHVNATPESPVLRV